MNRNQLRMLAADHPVGDPFRGTPYGERLDPGSVALAFGSLFVSSMMSDNNSGPAAAPAPVVAPPTVMPTPDDDAMKAAQRKQLAANQARRGRDSTILSNPNDTADLLGG